MKGLCGRGHYQTVPVQILLSIFSDVDTEGETICDLPQARIPELGLVLVHLWLCSRPTEDDNKVFILFALLHMVLGSVLISFFYM